MLEYAQSSLPCDDPLCQQRYRSTRRYDSSLGLGHPAGGFDQIDTHHPPGTTAANRDAGSAAVSENSLEVNRESAGSTVPA